LNYLLFLIDIIKEAGIIFKILKKIINILILLIYITLGRNIEFFDLKKYY